ncbi:DUF4442 domain-containing protein [Luteibaculum oceani]|uniref:DUF4442 domain-containing protein n=1 Tax=Luteibaculum oceani TaxID=1294296 RepID=A0A5C6UUA7_9FLAO|nr:DUF4442 domain-containing protein [Luteibaculum oceani]TXC76174.1 DUF4442 domain-containing protein [Luteibaculum oceani]
MNLEKLFVGVKKGGWGLTKLNLALSIAIPFNKPHGIKVKELGDNHVKTFVPYKRRNFNHIKGIHACALATVAEFCSGLLLLSRVNPRKYRIIMQELKVNYSYQAKSDTIAHFELSENDLQSEIMKPLKEDGVVLYPAKITLKDKDGNLVAEAVTLWQIKSWEKVKLKVD